MRNPISRDGSVCSIKQQYTKEASHEMHHEALRLNCPEALRTNAERERDRARERARARARARERERRNHCSPSCPFLILAVSSAFLFNGI